MSLISPQFGILLTGFGLVKALNRGTAFFERFLVGLRFHEPPTNQEVDALLAPPARGGPSTAAEREQRIDQTLEMHTKTIHPSWLPAAYQTVPWERLRDLEAIEGLTTLTALTWGVYLVIAAYECLRGVEPSYHATVMLVSVIIMTATSMISHVRRIGLGQADGFLSVAVGTLATIFSALSLLLIFNASPANYMSALQPTDLLQPTPSDAPAAPVDPFAEVEDAAASAPSAAAAVQTVVAPLAAAAVSTTAGPWIHLGSNLRLGMREAVLRMSNMTNFATMSHNFDVSDADRNVFAWILFISLACGLLVGLMVLPVLRVTRLYIDIEAAGKQLACGPANALAPGLPVGTAVTLPAMQRAASVWYYSTLLFVLWLVPYVGELVLHARLVHCGPGSISRDCVLSYPNGPEGEAVPVPWTRWYPLTETAWLRLRMMAVLAVSVAMVATLKTLLAVHLRSNKMEQRDILMAVAANVPGNKTRVSDKKKEKDAASSASAGAGAGATSGLPAGDVQRVHATLFNACSNDLRNVTMVTLQLLSVPILLSSLAALVLRMGGLNAGCCDGFNSGLQWGQLDHLLAWARHQSSNKGDVLQRLGAIIGQLMLGEGINLDIAAGRDKLIILTATFWRPVLSFMLFFTMLSINVMAFIGSVYWKLMRTHRDQKLEDAAAESSSNAAAAAEAKDGGKGGDKKKHK